MAEDSGDTGVQTLFTQNDTGEYVTYEPPTPPSFKESLPEELREHEYFQGVENTQQLAEAYANARKGMPVVPEDYSMDFPTDFDVDEEMYNGFKQQAREIGLTQTQFEKIMGFEIGRSQRVTEQMQNDVRQHREQAETALKTEWGEQYDQKIETAKRVFNRFADEKIKQMVEDTKFGDNPEVIRFMASIGEVLSEDILIGGNTPTEPTGREVGIDGRAVLSFPSMEEKK